MNENKRNGSGKISAVKSKVKKSLLQPHEGLFRFFLLLSSFVSVVVVVVVVVAGLS